MLRFHHDGRRFECEPISASDAPDASHADGQVAWICRVDGQPFTTPLSIDRDAPHAELTAALIEWYRVERARGTYF
jgi:hypothetical protein